ncbi:hypothetical protein FRC19_001730 [Serendipita sp. 401]|nr:hypothetical protein FRC19_001730 [Serendipita sp. 401]
MSSKDTPSRPIPIQRERSASLDSAGSNQVPALSASSSQSQSPPLVRAYLIRVALLAQFAILTDHPLIWSQSPSLPKQGVPASPILSYFFNKDGSPTSPNALKTGTSLSATIMEKDPNSGKPKLSPVLGHHRALSMNSDWPRFPSQQSPVSKPVNERGVGILRRLSISGTPFQRVSDHLFLYPASLFSDQVIAVHLGHVALLRNPKIIVSFLHHLYLNAACHSVQWCLPRRTPPSEVADDWDNSCDFASIQTSRSSSDSFAWRYAQTSRSQSYWGENVKGSIRWLRLIWSPPKRASELAAHESNL